MQDHEEEIILAGCGYVIEKLFMISSVLSEKIDCLFRLSKTIINLCDTCKRRWKMQKKQFPTQEELIRQAMAAMGSEDYSTMHKCSKPKGFPFVVTFTQRLSLKNIYTQTDAGFIQPA